MGWALRERAAEALAVPRAVNRALGLMDRELQRALQSASHTRHHPFPGRLTPHREVRGGVAGEPVPALVQFGIQLVQKRFASSGMSTPPPMLPTVCFRAGIPGAGRYPAHPEPLGLGHLHALAHGAAQRSCPAPTRLSQPGVDRCRHVLPAPN